MTDLTKAILYTWAPIITIAAIGLAITHYRRRRAWDRHADTAVALTKTPAAGGRGRVPRASRHPSLGTTPWHDSPCGCAARERPREIITCPKHAADQLVNLEAMWREEDAR